MKACARQFLTGCLAVSVSLFASVPATFAQNSQQVEYAPEFRQQELDQMLAPIALYPDSLLTQILMASTYPLEVVQAARWSRANPGLVGDQAVRAVERQNWDPSVQSLVAFPQVLHLLDSNLSWTERLGNAFLSQEAQVWDSVQILRQRADAAGNLDSNDDLRVERDGPIYVIESPRPDVIYVPYYDPLLIYGDWWWPGYAPMRWSPWPGYYTRPGFGRGYYWGGGVSVGFGFFFGGIDWRQRHASVINRNSFYYRNVNRGPSPGNGWQHDPGHRRGVPYRDPNLRQQFNRTPGASTTLDTRRDFRGRNSNTSPPADRGQPRPPVLAAPAGSLNPSSPATPRLPVASGTRAVPNDPAREYQNRAARPRTEQQPQALEGVGRGQDVRNASARGQASSQPRPPVAEASRRQPAPNNPQPVQRVQPQPQQQPQRSAPAPHPQPVQQEQRQQPAPQQNNAPRERERDHGRGEQQK